MKTRLLSLALLAAAAPLAVQALPNITALTQANGDANATEPAKFTGEVFTHTNLGANYRTPFFTGGEIVAFRDRVHEWTWAGPAIPFPSYLVGGELIQNRNDNRDNATLTLDVTIAEESWVYILVDNRLGGSANNTPPNFATSMLWLARDGFLPIMTGSNRQANNTIPDEIGIDEGADGAGPGQGINQWSSVYGKVFQPGTFTLYQADNAGQNMYGVVVKAVARAPRFAGGTGNLLGFNFQIEEGTVSQLNPQSLSVTLDGNPVTPTSVTFANGMHTVAYTTPSWLPSGSQHTVNIAYSDNAQPANNATATFNFTADTYPTLGAAHSIPMSAVDAASSGFLMRTVQYRDAARWPGNDLPNDTRRAEDQLAGRITDPVTLLPAENSAVPNAEPGSNGWYNPPVINLNDQNSGTIGSFVAAGTATSAPATDGPMYGIPGADPDTFNPNYDNYAAEILGYLQLQPGLYQFGVNSDDGFRLTAGKDPRSPNAVQIGVFSGGRGATDSLMYVEVAEAGIYPVRLLYYEGGGATASVEFFTRNYTTGMKTLVNDTANGGVTSYAKATAPTLSTSVSPLNGQTGVTPDYTVQAQVYENGAQVNTASIQMALNGLALAPTVTTANGVTSIVYEPNNDLSAGVNTVTLSFSDNAATPNTYSHEWTFTVGAYATLPVIPAAYAVPAEHLNLGINGFLADVYQMQNAAGTVIARTGFANNNSVDAAEFQLARGFIDPATSQPYANRVSPGGETDGRRFVDRINFNETGPANGGNFNSGNGFTDAAIPGLPNVAQDWVVGEFVTYIALKAGFHRLVVNCDDGFELTTAADPRNPGAGSILLGLRSPGGGSTDTFCDFFVQADGIYPLRLLWWEGTGGASLEFAYVDPETNARVLLGDIDRELAPKIYPYYLGPTRPQLRSITPTGNAVYPNAPISIVISDLAANAPRSLTLNGVEVPLSASVSGNLTTLTPTTPFTFTSGAAYNMLVTYDGIPYNNAITAIVYPDAPASMSRPAGDADQTASGFLARVFQATASPALATTIDRAERQIAGTLIDPATNQPYPNTATPGPVNGAYAVETINWSEDSATAGQQRGSFREPAFPDQPIPGVDVAVNSDNIATEFTAWLDLPAGITQLGVNSDDGFLLTVGHAVGAPAIEVGKVDAGRGAADTALAVNVAAAGLYPVRLVWFEGGGDASVEFFSVTQSGQKILVNDRATAGHIKAYYRLTGGPLPDPTLTFSASAGSITLNWENGTLRSTTDLNTGPWVNVSEAQSGTHTEPMTGNKYFRVYRP